MKQSIPEFDVIVVGAGMAGLALCAALGSNHSLRILLIEPQQPPKQPVKPSDSFDPRVSALSLASQRLLHNLGVWDGMLKQRVSPYQRMQVWDGEGTAQVVFDAGDIEQTNLGHIVENTVTLSALWQRVQNLPGVTLVNAGLSALQRIPAAPDMPSGAPNWLLCLDDQTQYQSSLVIGADGVHSKVRQCSGIATRHWSYQQAAIVTTVKTEQPHQGCARQVFLNDGPLAFLPLHDQSQQNPQAYSSIVWTQSLAAAEQCQQLDAAAFKQALGRAFEHHLGAIVETDKRHCFALEQEHAINYIVPGLALIGDAAHRIHPLAGQGINLGFLDVAVLAEELQRNLDNGLAVYEFSGLRRYQRRRKSHNLLTMATMEGFKRLYQPMHWLAITARNLAMQEFDRHYLAKRQAIYQAAGLSEPLPELMQPQYSSASAAV